MVDLSEFFSIQAGLLRQIPRKRSRYLNEIIDWNTRLLGIVGGRGTGKTTLLLQHLAEQAGRAQEHLYISADHIRVQAIGIYEISASFFRLGGKGIVIDEVHKYADWAQEIKNLYDSFPDSRIFFSGSSTLALQTGKADLSRRAVFYALPGLSFREYLYLAHGLEQSSTSLSNLLDNHHTLASEILKAGPILGHFMDYLDHGVYPFFLEGIRDYVPKLLNILEKVLYEDIPSAIGIKATNVPVLKRLLWLIATSQPFTTNIERMSRDLRISKAYTYTYLDALERAGLLSGFLPAETGYRLVKKPSKIYIENSNLLRGVAGELGTREQTGAVRETFFTHQLKSAGKNIRIPSRGDFLVEERYLFEIGGKGKSKKQILDADNAFVVRDQMEIGFDNIIPLWLFGFLY
jgi:predicted AAA+ superfamily ATPase